MSKKSRKTKKTRKRSSRVSESGVVGPGGIDAGLKTIVVAAEPPINADPAKLTARFRSRLEAALADLKAQGHPFKLVEGFRTTERQQWLFGSGRPGVVPFGRPGPIVTHADGVIRRSRHQGVAGSALGSAADCYPLKGKKVFIPPNTHPAWGKYAVAVEKQGLVAGHNFPRFKDSPHCELD